MRKPLERYLDLEYTALLVAEPEGGYTARFGAPTPNEPPPGPRGVRGRGGDPRGGPGQPGGGPEALVGDRLRVRGRDSLLWAIFSCLHLPEGPPA